MWRSPLGQTCDMPAPPVRSTFAGGPPTPWVSEQSQASRYYRVVIHCLWFVRIVTNNHGKKLRLLDLTPVFSAGCFAEPRYMCHPLLHRVLHGSQHGLRGAPVSSTLPSHRIRKLESTTKGVYIYT